MAPNQIVYEVLPLEKWREAVPIVKDVFVSDEPLDRFLGITPDVFDAMMPGGFEGVIKDNTTVVARNGEGGEIVGAKIFSILKRGEKLNCWADLHSVNQAVDNFKAFVISLENGFNMFEAYPTIDYAYEHILLCVRKEFAGRGIGTGLVEMSDNLAIEKSCKYAKVIVTAPGSYKCFSRCGYKSINEAEYLTFEVDGKKIFDPKVVGNHASKAHIMIKKLQ